MHRAADPVPDKFTNHAEPVRFDVFLYRARNIANPFARNGLRNSLTERLLGHIHQPLGFHRTTTDRNGPGGVTNEAIMNDTNIQAHNVPKLNLPLAGQPMNNLLINGNANVTRVFSITQKSAPSAVMFYPGGRELVDFARGHSRLDEFAHFQ